MADKITGFLEVGREWNEFPEVCMKPNVATETAAVASAAEVGPLDDLMPTDPWLAGPWVSAVSWALGEEKVMDQFRSDTGNRWKPGRSPIERMIDQATGVELIFIRQFLVWFNREIWGDLDLQAFPEKLQ